MAGDSPLAEAIQVTAWAHQNLIWDRHLQLLRNALREFLLAVLQDFDDVAAPDALELLAAAPDPPVAARLSKSRIMARSSVPGAATSRPRPNGSVRAYDLRKLRGKDLVIKPDRSRRYHIPAPAARTIAALLTLRDEVIGPILAGVRSPRLGRKPTTLDHHRPRLRDPSHRHADPLP